MSIGIITVEFLVIGVCSQGLISLKTLLVTEFVNLLKCVQCYNNNRVRQCTNATKDWTFLKTFNFGGNEMLRPIYLEFNRQERFTACLSNSTSRHCLFVNVNRHYHSWISGHRCLQSGSYFAENIACNWIAVSPFAIASQFDIPPFAVCETWLRT